MTDVKPASDTEIENWLSNQCQWVRKNNALTATFKFVDHAVLFQAICDIHSLAERHNHHPEVHYVYNVLDLKLTTHDAGNKISQRDFQLAEEINKEILPVSK